MVLTKALEAYAKYFKWISVLVLPVGMVIGLLLWGIMSTENHELSILISFNIPGWLLSPLWIGPLLYCLSWLDSGQEFRYQTIMANGLKPWWKLLIIPVIIIGFKYLAALGTQWVPEYGRLVWALLLLIGAVIGIRYIFIFPVLALEEYNLIQVWHRCASLSKGKHLSMFFELIALWLLLYVTVFIITMLLGMAANLGPGIVSTFIYFIVVSGIIYPLGHALIIVWIYYSYKKQINSEDCQSG